MMGLITAVFGGRPGMISGATGAMAVVMVHMIQQGNAVSQQTYKQSRFVLAVHYLALCGGNSNECWGVQTRKICSSHSPPRHDGFCQWSRYRNFLIATSPFKTTTNGETAWLSVRHFISCPL